MGLIHLQKMSIRGFRSLAEEATVLFEQSGMVLVRGTNMDTLGSSGSGKSNVLLALTYAFDHCPLPAKELQNWDSEQAPQVEVWFDIDGAEYHLLRSSKPSLSGPHGETTGARAVNAKLQEIIGLDTELLAALTFREQKARGIFLSKNDAEKKEFLTKLLRLDSFENEYDKATKAASTLAAKMETLSGREALLAEQNQTAKSKISEPVYQDEEPLVKEIKGRSFERNAKLSQLLAAKESVDRYAQLIAGGFVPDGDMVASIEKSKSEFDAAKAKAPPYLLVEGSVPELTSIKEEIARRIHETDTQLGALHENHRDLTEVVRAEQRLLLELAHIEEQIAQLKDSKCPECERPWDAPARLAEKIAEAQVIHTRIQHVEQAKVAIGHNAVMQKEQSDFRAHLHLADRDITSKLEAEYSRIDREEREHEQKTLATLFDLNQKLAKAEGTLREEAALWKARTAEEAHRLAARLMDASVESADAKNKVQELEHRLEGLRRANSVIKAESERVARLAQEAEAAWQKARTDYEAVKKDYSKEVDWAKAIKGFLGSVFDESLVAIADVANKLIAQLPNTAHITLSFKSEGVTLKGTVKQEIKPVVSVNGHETTLKGGCSGGQVTSIELAVDLAVATVVQERTGTAPGWLILDETFEGQDSITKESCMELLKQYASGRLVLVVDHSSEFKELFSSFINVEFANGKSRLV